jgi:4,4'-diaponeurosporenoate glycosyltransferase
MIFNLTILILGLLASRYLFWRLPNLTQTENGYRDFVVSVVIPARNEEKTLPLLLEDLKHQTLMPMEIICVNDGSTDRTRQLILDAGGPVKLVDVMEKPSDWMGKAWACLQGAELANGELLLFLDADVRLGKDALAKLADTYRQEPSTISVQPYHKMSGMYENLSLFFNLIEVGANGTGIPGKRWTAGLYGPVILIPKADYDDIGGHRVARQTIVDDLTLGDALKRAGKQYRLYLGGKDISFRMYGEGISALFHGWTKNFATGLGKTPGILLPPVFFWVTSCTAAPLYFLQSALSDGNGEGMAFSMLGLPGEVMWPLIYLAGYVLWVGELNRIVPKIGNFRRFTLLIYPVFMLAFLLTFFWSLWKKIFHRKVTWKGRTMKPEA